MQSPGLLCPLWFLLGCVGSTGGSSVITDRLAGKPAPGSVAVGDRAVLLLRLFLQVLTCHICPFGEHAQPFCMQACFLLSLISKGISQAAGLLCVSPAHPTRLHGEGILTYCKTVLLAGGDSARKRGAARALEAHSYTWQCSLLLYAGSEGNHAHQRRKTQGLGLGDAGRCVRA